MNAEGQKKLTACERTDPCRWFNSEAPWVNRVQLPPALCTTTVARNNVQFLNRRSNRASHPTPQLEIPPLASTMSGIHRPTSTGSRMSSAPSSQKPRQLSHLHSQLAQLTANMADLENLLRMTAVQAESMRGLGGYCGGMYV